MSYEDVVKIYGKPTFQHGNVRDIEVRGSWVIAPERCAPNPEEAMIPYGFDVEFNNAKVVRWQQSLGPFSRKEKVIGLGPATLKVILPVVDVTKGEVDRIWYFENTKVPDPSQPLNKRDLQDLLAMTEVLLSPFMNMEKLEAARIDSDCDFMKTLAHNFPEVEEARKQADAGKVEMKKLLLAVSPYRSGEKPLVPENPAPPK